MGLALGKPPTDGKKSEKPADFRGKVGFQSLIQCDVENNKVQPGHSTKTATTIHPKAIAGKKSVGPHS